MPDRIDDGGHVHACASDGHHSLGITRRDWLAGLAMQGMFASSPIEWNDQQRAEAVISMPELAYYMADSMIAKSKQTKV